MEAACESNSSVHVTFDVPSILTPIRSPRPPLTMGSHLPRDPFELPNLIPAGVLVLTLSGLRQNLPGVVFREAWSAFDSETEKMSLRPFCSPKDAALLEGLSFLVTHEFARVTSNFLSLHNLLLLRVYIVPYDLPGVQGRLMNRQEYILARYRRYMKDMLPRIVSDDDYWKGADVLPPNPSLFLPPSLVGVFIGPSNFIGASELITGFEEHGGDIQRTTHSCA